MPRLEAGKDYSPFELEVRRAEIISGAAGDYKNISTDDLHELHTILTTMRRKTAGPPKSAKGSKAKKQQLSLDSVLDTI